MHVSREKYRAGTSYPTRVAFLPLEFALAIRTMPSDTKTTDNSKVSEEKKGDPTYHLGVLEEDDEFEEFAAAGPSSRYGKY